MKVHQHFRLNMAFPTHGPMVIANLTQPVEFIPKSSRVYLLDQNILDTPDTRILARTNLGVLTEVRVPWSILENVRVEIVPQFIGAKCFQASQEDNERFAKLIRETHVREADDWSVSVD